MSHLLVQIVDRLLDVDTVCYLVLRHFCDGWKLRRQYLLLVMTVLNRLKGTGHPKIKNTYLSYSCYLSIGIFGVFFWCCEHHI